MPPKAGPSNQKASTSSTSIRPPPKGIKVINRTVDLLRKNEGLKVKGKGKEREILGDVQGLIQASRSLPGALQVERFAETRALEILAFQTAIKTASAQGNNRTFQSLPRHLRRRAASHNPRRVPKRLRSRAAAEIQATDNIAKLHRKRAKLRAKGNLRGESRTEQLMKRQRDKCWLSTHIYHAKRFHMQNIWGYRLALTPTLKSFRPAYRAARKRAVVHDVSYIGILELEGRRELIIHLLGRMTGGGRFAGDKFESGARAAQIYLYHFDTYPQNLIGPVEIVWQPAVGDTESRTIWIRLHPSIYNEAWDALRSSLAQLMKTIALDTINVQMRDLRGDVEAFEIIGPRAARVLKRILRLCKSENGQKKQFFNGLGGIEPEEIPDSIVVGLKVQDPRLHFPPPMLASEDVSMSPDGVLRAASLPQPSAELASSSLWDHEERDRLSKPKYKKSDLDRRREKLQLPGTRLRPLAKDDRIPIMLIQRSISSPSGREGFHGFTLLFPKGWSNYLLSSIVFTSTLPIGIAERRVQYREAGIPSFPEHYGSVCSAGKSFEKGVADEAEKYWNRRPPGKRPEYKTLGTKSPFVPDWDTVLGNQDRKGEDYLTEEEIAVNGESSKHEIKPWLVTSPIIENLQALIGIPNPAKRLATIVNAFREQRGIPSTRSLTIESDKMAEKLYQSALINVKITVLGRGSPTDMAIIYQMTLEDREEWLAAFEEDGVLGRAGYNMDMTETGISRIQKLGEIKPNETDIIGYVSTGNFSMSRGKGHALGSVSLARYLNLLNLSSTSSTKQYPGQAIVKLRNRDGVICRLARVEAVCGSF